MPRHSYVRHPVTGLTFLEWQVAHLLAEGWAPKDLSNALAIPLKRVYSRAKAAKTELRLRGFKAKTANDLAALRDRGVL